MDKNKNRTDLLAAGRKKLQQYRQKKDNKSSNQGKSLNKASKSEHEVDADVAYSAMKQQRDSPQIPEDDIKLHLDSDKVVVDSPSNPTENSMATQLDVSPVDQSSLSTLGSTDARIEGKAPACHSEREYKQDDVSGPVGLSEVAPPLDATDGNEVPVEVRVHTDSERKDQVIDGGATQEAGCASSKESDRSNAIETEGSTAADQHNEDAVASSFNEGESASLSLSDDLGSFPKEGFETAKEDLEAERLDKSHYLHDASFTSEGKSHADVGSISISQLAEVMRGLNEDKFKLLIDSRKSASKAESGNPGTSIVHDHCSSHVFEKLKEQLYLTNFAKDSFHLQLDEQSRMQMELDCQHQQLLDEISKLSDSLSEVRLRNETLASELVECRGLLEDSQLENSNLKGHLVSVTEEKVKLEEEKQNYVNDNEKLSMELTDCKGLIATLQVQIANLSENLDYVTEEREKLLAEQEEFVYENDKLSKELADCNSYVAALRVEVANFSGMFTSAEEEKKKFEVEKENFVHENEKLATELADSKNLVAALQAEIANGGAIFNSVTEERKRIEQEKENVAHENAKLSTKLAECEGFMEDLQAVNKKFEKEKENFLQENEKLSTESADCKDLVAALLVEIAIYTEIVFSVTEEGKNFVQENKNLAHENDMLAKELADLKLQVPNLSGSFISSTDEKKNFLEEKDYLFHENEKLLKDLADCRTLVSALQAENADLNQRLASVTEERNKLQLALKEAALRLEELTEENLFIHSSLDIYEAKLTEIKDSHVQLSSQAVESVIQFSDQNKSFNIAVIMETLKDAEKIIEKLEKAIESMHSRAVSLSKSSGKAAPGISKLIQAFESKTHPLVNELEDTADPFMIAREQMRFLKALVNGFGFRELQVHYEGLTEHVNNLEAAVIELEVLSEVTKQHVSAVESNNSKLEVLYEDLKQQAISFKSEHSELVQKLTYYQSRISELQILLDELQHSSDDVASTIFNEVKDLQKEVAKWGSAMDPILETVAKLEAFIERFLKKTISSDGLDIGQHVYMSINTAIEVIEELHGNLEAARADHEAVSSSYKMVNDSFNELHERNELAIDVLNKIYCHLKNLVSVDDLFGYVQRNEVIIQNENLLNFSKYEPLIEQLGKSNRERFQLESLNDQLNLELMNRKKELDELQEKIQQLNSLTFQQENEILVLKESVKEKITELEQSEQRISSAREKLSIAVAKGKGLIVQRDNLKHSLLDSSKELERLSQELQSRDANLHEVETKLKSYAEAGERIEALESELSYIRNSATALRESFLLKDSVLQRIEEILEDLDLPEDFHSGDILEKIDWLARSVTGNSLPLTDWNQKPLPDSGFVDMEEDPKRKYQDLESKFYELAEQNEMLEQSLVERNKLIQRWEGILDRISMPSQLRSMETENRIEWLGSALSEAHHDQNCLREKIDNLETYCQSLTAEVEGSIRRIHELEEKLQATIHEREQLSENLNDLIHEHERVNKNLLQFKIERDEIQNELTNLKEKIIGKEEHIYSIEVEIRKLQGLVSDALQDNGTEIVVSSGSDTDYLERLLRKLIENYKSLSMEKYVVTDNVKYELDLGEQNIRERDGFMQKIEQLVTEIEVLKKERDESKEQLNQEEQKSASVREKLNVAVRKGKSLVQQRDTLKQTIEEINTQLNDAKSENAFLSKQLKETENFLQEKEHALSNIFISIGSIDFGDEFNITDPIEKLKHTGKVFCDLRGAISSSENEVIKSKRAAELLLEELNEVQDRNDNLQEELLAKIDAVLHLEKLIAAHSEERKKQYAEFMALQSEIDEMRKGFVDFNNKMSDVFSKDLEYLKSLEDRLESCVAPSDDANTVDIPYIAAPTAVVYNKADDKDSRLATYYLSDSMKQDRYNDKIIVEVYGFVEEFIKEFEALREKLNRHSVSLYNETNHLFQLITAVQREIVSRKELLESLKSDIIRQEASERDKDEKIASLQKLIALLYEACTIAVMEIENKSGGKSFINQTLPSSEEKFSAMANRLIFVVKDYSTTFQTEIERSQKEMKATILNLQNELHEKDIQRERVCLELINQIKEAETNSTNLSVDLQSTKRLVNDLEKQVERMETERTKELKEKEATLIQLQEKVKSLTDLLPAKEQEIEALMQALDEEEAQMEGLSSKFENLEKIIQEKNLELEKLESSHKKAVKKLSITVSKFDELHLLTQNLLSEVENLQSQLQNRDSEISFLRQEVTRCTNEVLSASQLSQKNNSVEIFELLTWFDSMISRVRVQNLQFDGHRKKDQVDEYKERLQKEILAIVTELEDLRVVAQSRDALLQVERSKVNELSRRGEILESSLHEKESQLSLLQGSVNSEILEAEPAISKRAVTGTPITPQVRSLRKVNSDQVAIAIDMDPSSTRLDDEDDDKVHGFKSLATSKVVPRFTRAVTDMIDGLWVSCDRALMRQPALRLGIIIYWAVLHALVATFVV